MVIRVIRYSTFGRYVVHNIMEVKMTGHRLEDGTSVTGYIHKRSKWMCPD